MKNSFFDLPYELQSYIYSFDDTFHHNLNQVKDDIKSLKIMRHKKTKKYIIIDYRTNKISVTNLINDPYYLLPYCDWTKKHIHQLQLKGLLTTIFPIKSH